MNQYFKHIISKVSVWAINIVFGLCILLLSILMLQIFFFSSFTIPSNSMSPALITGDNIVVCKPILGPRLFNLFASLREEQTKIYRVPGFRKVKRNDVLVFNFPHPTNWQKIEMHIMKYYIKRCVALPGDTFFITDGVYKVKGVNTELGNIISQKRFSVKKDSTIKTGVFYGFPYDSIIKWNIKNFGPFYIPQKGDKIPLNRTNAVLYKKAIEWEQHGELKVTASDIYLNGKPITNYTFQKNYYFMAGDRVEDSQDSRYWGLLPEEYIAGKAWLIWKSTNTTTGAFRWDRFLKQID